MASSVGGQAIVAPNLTNATLLADLQYMEPYTSQGLNRKLRNIVLPGIYNGFSVSPGTGLSIKVSSTSENGGGASINISDRYQISVQQLKDAQVTVPAGRTSIVVLQANYSFGVYTTQVNTNAQVDAAAFVVIDVATPLTSNQIEMCRVTVPSAATQVTEIMIDRSHRIVRRIGVQLTDRTDWANSDIAASAAAVKAALAVAQTQIDKKLPSGQYGIGAETIPVASNFDWQQYTFHGDEYVYIQWSAAKNNPNIDYPDGYYQISVLGLSDQISQSLLIRPVNYLQPLAPFMISWTGAKGNRSFKTRAVFTSLGDINDLGSFGPNDLIRHCHIGEFGQTQNAQALVEKGYPAQEAGTLRVMPSAYGVQQEYLTFSSGRRYVRNVMADHATWTPWKEIPNLSNDLMMVTGKIIGVSASESNRVYFTNEQGFLSGVAGSTQPAKLVNAAVFEWYASRFGIGVRRGSSTDSLGLSIEVNGKELARFTPGGDIQAYGGRISVLAATPVFSLYDGSATELGNINFNTASGTLNLWNHDATNLQIYQHGITSSGGTVTGGERGLIRGPVQGGDWATWRDRAAGLLIDMGAASTAYNVWKATHWGTAHIAAMQVADFGTSQQVTLSVAGHDFSFGSNGDALASCWRADGSLRGAGGYANQLNSGAPFYQDVGIRPDNDNTYFPLIKGRSQITSGYPCAVSFGLITQGVTWAGASIQVLGDNAGAIYGFASNGTFNTASAYATAVVNANDFQARSHYNIGDNDSGLYNSGQDGVVGMYANGAGIGYWSNSELHHNGNISAGGTLLAGAAQFGTDGNSYGSIWGGYLSNWINQRIQDSINWSTNNRGTKQTWGPATNGWWKCNDTGMIRQWGVADKNALVTYTAFPIQFPNTCANVQMTLKDVLNNNSMDSSRNIATMTPGVAGFQWVANTAEYRIFWEAIGW